MIHENCCIAISDHNDMAYDYIQYIQLQLTRQYIIMVSWSLYAGNATQILKHKVRGESNRHKRQPLTNNHPLTNNPTIIH